MGKLRGMIWIMFEKVSIAKVFFISITNAESSMIFMVSILNINITEATRSVELTIIGLGIIASSNLFSTICNQITTHGLMMEALCRFYVGPLAFKKIFYSELKRYI